MYYLSRKYDASNGPRHHNLRHADVYQLTTLLHAMQRSDILILFKAFDTHEENSKMNDNDKQITSIVSTIVFHNHINQYMFN